MREALLLEKSFRSMTPDSWNSIQRSLPSRVRSPTPANTEKPPCWVATLLMSSWMMTVLPTPAPPNRPILPPLRKGWIRSMTLMPVSNISSLVDCSSNAGAWRWIGANSLEFRSEQADLAAFKEGLDQVDDLDAGLKHLFAGRLLVERRGLAMDRRELLGVPI